MNTSLTLGQIKKIFALYWEQRVLMLNLHSDRLLLVDHHFYVRFSFDMKLALIPLDKVSDEHAIEIGLMWGFRIDDKNRATVIEKSKHIIEGFVKITMNSLRAINIYQQLIYWGYAVPLFIEPGNPDNGKTAIELDIAIDKTLITFKN